MNYGRKVVRSAIDASQVGAKMTDRFTGGQMSTWRGVDTEFQLAFFLQNTLLSMANYSSLKLEVFASQQFGLTPLMSKTIGSDEINTGLILADWQSGADQHVVIPFTAQEVNLDLDGKTEASFWLVVSGLTSDSPARLVTLGAGLLKVTEDATPTTSLGPVQGGNIIPLGAMYDGNGHYALTVEAGRTLNWSKGAHDTSITNDTQTITDDGNFITADTTITLNGTPDVLVTAIIRTELFFTADESDARYLQHIIGVYDAGTDYITGQVITDQGGLWVAKQNTTAHTPPTLPTTSNAYWLLIVAPGVPGADGDPGADGLAAYLYVAYASDNSGTGFSLTPGSGLKYIAVTKSTTVISSPGASDFTGLWQKYRGDDGATAYLYVGYASDNSGTGFSLTPSPALPYIALKQSSSALTPIASDFAGLWVKFLGTDGTGIGDMVLAAAQTVTGAKTYSPAALRVFNSTSDFYTALNSLATVNRALNLPDKDGTLSIEPAVSTLTYASTVTVDFTGDKWKQLSLTGDVIFTSTNRGSGRSLIIEVVGDASNRALTFPAQWRWVAEPAPATLAANKLGLLFLYCFGATEGDVCALWWAEGSVTSYQTIAVSTDSTNNIAPAAGFGLHGVYLTVQDGSYNTPYTAKLVLLRLNATAGDTVDVYVDMPADSDPTIEFYDNDTDGDPIFSFQGRKTAIPVFCKFKYTGTAWKIFQYSAVRNTQVATEYVLDTLAYASSLVIDFDGGSYQVVTLTGDVTITTKNRASTGFAKAVTVKLIASGGSRGISLDSDIIPLNSIPVALFEDKSNWLSLTSTGPDETDTEAAIICQP